jgi:hypothetical protein
MYFKHGGSLCGQEMYLEGETLESCKWVSENTVPRRNQFRRDTAEWIRCRGIELREAGAVEKWMVGLDVHTRAVLGEFNGPLLKELMEWAGIHDDEFLEMMRGAPLAGRVSTSGRGKPKEPEVLESIEELWRDRKQINKQVIRKLRSSELDDDVMRLTLEEHKLKRISKPVVLEPGSVEGLLCHRFGVDQGDKPRCIDDGTGCRCNPCSGNDETLREHRLSYWFQIVQLLMWLGVAGLTTCKVDINAAFRRIPILKEHRWMAEFAFMFQNRMWHAAHYAMPFGYKGSVYAWEKLSNILWCIATKLLLLPLGKYVDDYFAVEAQECIEEALSSVAVLFRAILGDTALAAKKILSGNPLPLLGFDICIVGYRACFGVQEAKRVKWLAQIKNCRQKGVLTAAVAAKLAGRFSFVAEFMFRRLGRAMIKPVFAQQHRPTRGGRISAQLDSALHWWEMALGSATQEEHELFPSVRSTAELFVDAAGSPPHLAAVLVIDGHWFYSDAPVPDTWMDWFDPRSDDQIMGLELLAILFGMMTFSTLLANRTFRVWTDNSGAEGAVARGGSAQRDHNAIIHQIWTYAYTCYMNPWFARVPSDDNVSDGPTRGDHRVVRALGALKVVAQVPPVIE